MIPTQWRIPRTPAAVVHQESITHPFSFSRFPESDTAMHFVLFTSLLILHIAHFINALCPACGSYSAALKSCQSNSANLTLIGSAMDTASIDCMCMSRSSTTQKNTCQGCQVSSTSAEDFPDPSLLLTWYFTCKASDQWGDQQGVACWEGQPLNLAPCVSNTVRQGGGSTSGGSAGEDSATK